MKGKTKFWSKLLPKTNYVEKNVTFVATLILFTGCFLSFTSPFLFTEWGFLGLSAANEIGDAIGGMTNPIVALTGMLLTFLAFFVQYKANERQTNELEKQKLKQEFRQVKDSLRTIKDDIRSIIYTREGVPYSYSEAIWFFIKDCFEREEPQVGPVYYQIVYAISLFEPVIAEVEELQLEKMEKYRVLTEIEAIFSASINLVLHVQDSYTREQQKPYLRTNILVPAKRVKLFLQSAIDKYRESEKDMFDVALKKMKGGLFIKSAKIAHSKAVIHFYKNIEEFWLDNPGEHGDSSALYENNFGSEDKIIKFLASESARILSKLNFLDKISLELPTNGKDYMLTMTRKDFEDFTGLDLTELQIDRNVWRDDFLGKFVYDSKELKKFEKQFIRISSV